VLSGGSVVTLDVRAARRRVLKALRVTGEREGAALGVAGSLLPRVFRNSLCTPKDVLARRVPATAALRAGGRAAFSLAGAYAWNVSHHDFLMHPGPASTT
jgi:hypothetical protein